MTHALLFWLGRNAGFGHEVRIREESMTMNASKHTPWTSMDAAPVAGMSASRLPAQEKLVIEHLHEFAAASVTGMCHITASDSLSFLGH
jgi:hypothetical protein